MPLPRSTGSSGSRRRGRSPSGIGPATAVALALLAASCGGGGHATSSPGGGVTPPSSNSDLYYISDPHLGGQAPAVRIEAVSWGRLVDVYDQFFDVAKGKQVSRKILENFLIGDDINNSTNPLEFKLEANPVTGQENVTISHKVGTPEFGAAVSELTAHLMPLLVKGLNATPPFSAVPRNAALSIRFNDLLDSATIRLDTVMMHTGNPPKLPFELRVLPDPSHGGEVGGSFHTTRVILDLTVSTFESQLAGGSLPVNALGLPSAVDPNQSNTLVRIPTQKSISQFALLANLAGHFVSFTGNGPNDPGSPTLDVLRALRSQGKTAVTGDPNNGFLSDDIKPSILGAQPVAVTFAQKDPTSENEWTVDLLVSTPSCALPARPGDVLQLPNSLVAQVLTTGSLSGALVSGARVRILSGKQAQFGAGLSGQFKSTWDPALGVAPACFVRFNPLPGSAPNFDVSTSASVIVSFSEPMDPASVQALDSLTLAYEFPPNANPMWSNVIGRILPSQDLRDFQFQPAVFLRHSQGSAEQYFIAVVGDDPTTGTPGDPQVEGITDLAGNPLIPDLTGQQAASFTMRATDAAVDSAGIGLKFAGLDEDGNGLPELRGQFLIDTTQQTVKPRSVSRFSVVLDPNQPLIGVMPQTSAGLVTPLSNWGSKLMSVWRYVDLGFGLLDDINHNLDVERLHWAPFAPAVQQDQFSNYQISLSHCFFLPDEGTTTNFAGPAFPGSGLVAPFTNNLLDPLGDPLTTVAAKANGYTIDPLLSFPASTGTLMMPWPINVNVALEDYVYWTWRDTAKTQLGGCTGAACGPGADPNRLQQILGIGDVGFYPSGEVPTIALPLLTEYRCYPDPNAFGLNGLRTSYALNSSPWPAFRSYSTGGSFNGMITQIDPDSNLVAQGGIDPSTGLNTPGLDNTFYWGQADFTVRVSRMHTIWFDTGSTHTFGQPVIEPDNTVQPSNTQVSLAFRGATSVTASAGKPWEDANQYDPYGNGYTQAQLNALAKTSAPFSVAFVPAGNTAGDWHPNSSDIDWARYIQVRVTFVCNAESHLSPTLSALGFAFRK